MARMKKISLGNWMLIGMLLGFLVGIILNFYVDNPFIKDTLLINNVFYLGGTGFIRLMKMLVVPLVFFSIVVGVASISDIKKGPAPLWKQTLKNLTIYSKTALTVYK